MDLRRRFKRLVEILKEREFGVEVIVKEIVVYDLVFI